MGLSYQKIMSLLLKHKQGFKKAATMVQISNATFPRFEHFYQLKLFRLRKPITLSSIKSVQAC